VREKILMYILNNGDATFIGLENYLGESAKGNMTWEIIDNVTLWAGMSDDFIAAMMSLRKDELIEPSGTQLLVYLIDGGTLNLPIAKRPKSTGYKKEHWLPVIFHLTEKGKAEALKVRDASRMQERSDELSNGD